jgi:hypothetical protein
VQGLWLTGRTGTARHRFDNPPLLCWGDGTRHGLGDEGNAAGSSWPVALLSEHLTEQKRNSVLSITGTGAGWAYLS